MTRPRITRERQKIVALDTNIFIYHFEEHPSYVEFTEALFERIESGRARAVTSALTLHEVLTGARRAGNERLASLYRDLIGTFPNLRVVPFDARIAEISSDLRARYDLPTPDAIQMATALHEGAETIVTNDSRLKRVREIRVTIPRKTG